MKKAMALAAVLCVVFVCTVCSQDYTILHDFAGPPGDGTGPWGNLTSDGTRLYGMTQTGGVNGAGIVFSINTDGSGYTMLHEFPDPAPAIAPDGTGPWGDVIVTGDTLYGMTQAGGTNLGGIVFSMNTDGSGYTKLHEFPDPAVGNDGATPFGSLVSDDSTLYGMTIAGGAGWAGGYYSGTVFSLNTDGTAYTILHSFTTGPYDGIWPWGNLISDGSTLYGMTPYGGAYGALPVFPGYGTIFSLESDGSDFALLHSFSGQPNDGATPYGSLVSDGSMLYGMTFSGGTHGAAPGNGTIFSYALPTPTPTPTPLIDLKVNKTTFSTTDRITINADVQPTSTSFQPYVRITFPNSVILYLVRDAGFTVVQTPYLAGGPFVLRNLLSDYPVLDASFSIVQTGNFLLEGFPHDVFGDLIGTVDQEPLTVQ